MRAAVDSIPGKRADSHGRGRGWHGCVIVCRPNFNLRAIFETLDKRIYFSSTFFSIDIFFDITIIKNERADLCKVSNII